MGITDRTLVHYHLLLTFVAPGCLIGAAVRFSQRAADGKYHLHTPASGALIVNAAALAMLVVGFAILTFRLDWAMEKYKAKAAKLMRSRNLQAFNLLAPAFFLAGVVMGAHATNDVAWAVADGCSMLALWFAVWGTWALVTLLDKCVVPQAHPVPQGHAATARDRGVAVERGAAVEQPPMRPAPLTRVPRPAPKASNPLAAVGPP